MRANKLFLVLVLSTDFEKQVGKGSQISWQGNQKWMRNFKRQKRLLIRRQYPEGDQKPVSDNCEVGTWS